MMELSVKGIKGQVRPRKGLAAITLSAIAVAGLGGCANPFHHSAAATKVTVKASATSAEAVTGKTTVTAKTKTETAACVRQETWNASAASSLQALYAAVGALSADERAGNATGVVKAGRKLAADAVAAATLSLPPVDQQDWKALIAAYAAAGTALARGSSISAVPQLEAGGSAITAFATAVAECQAGS